MSTQEPFWVRTEDYHTAGEPFRIVPSLPPHIQLPSIPIPRIRNHILNTPNHPLDTLRKSLCHEPRGHADMYGGFILPASSPTAHFGVLFFHKDGFSTACGHGTIALGRWAVASGIVEGKKEGVVEVRIDVPSGLVVANVAFQRGEATHVDFVNVESYQFANALPISVDLGDRQAECVVDLAWGGATYASIDTRELGLKVQPENFSKFVELGRQIKHTLGDTADHANTKLYGVCFFETLNDNPEVITQRNVVVFADGQIDRSPCGSGTAARVAILLSQGKLDESKKLVHYSIIDTVFEAWVLESRGMIERYRACVPVVRGDARLTGRHEFWIDPGDVTYPGFLFR